MLGTIVNSLSVLAGGLVGYFFAKNFSKNLHKAILYALGIFTLFLGLKMSLEAKTPIIIVLSLVLGTFIGEVFSLQKGVEFLTLKLKRQIKSKDENFSDGLITAFILFCVGSMTIIGTMEEGILGKTDILFTKSVMDGFAAFTLSSVFGIGVIFSIFPLFIFQGGLTLFFQIMGQSVSLDFLSEISALGGLLIIGIGINLLEIKKIRVINMLPSFFILLGILSILKNI